MGLRWNGCAGIIDNVEPNITDDTEMPVIEKIREII